MAINFEEQVAIKTEQELIDIYINQEEYQQSFVNAAVGEMAKRNISLDPYLEKRSQREKTIAETLERGVPGDPAFIVLTFISAFLGGFLGIIGGFIYSQSKKDGRYFYNESTRKKGRIMLVTGIIVLIATLAWKFS